MLVKEQSRLYVRMHLFSQRTINKCNKLFTYCMILCLPLEVTNDNFHGVHRLELYIVAFKKIIASLILVAKI